MTIARRRRVLDSATQLAVLLAVLFFAQARACAAPAQPSDAVSEKARSAIKARLRGLQNVDVEYDQITDYTPSKNAIDFCLRVSQQRPREGRYESACRFSYLAGRARFENAPSPQTLSRGRGDKPVLTIFISTVERTEVFSQYQQMGRGGLIADTSRMELPRRRTIDVALGLRGDAPAAAWLDEKSLAGASVARDPAAPDLMVLAIPSGVGPLDSWWFSKVGSSYEIVKYTYADPSSGQIYNQIDCSDFRIGADGFSLPQKVVERAFFKDEKEDYCNQTETLNVVKYHDASENTPERYLMVWPLGSKVTDVRTKQTFIVRSSPRTLDDGFIAAASETKLKKVQERLNQIATQPAPSSQP